MTRTFALRLATFLRWIEEAARSWRLRLEGREFIAGLAEGQEITVQCNWFKGSAKYAILAAKGTTHNFRIVYSDPRLPEQIGQRSVRWAMRVRLDLARWFWSLLADVSGEVFWWAADRSNAADVAARPS